MSNVIDFPRKKKDGLYVDQTTGKMMGSPHYRRPEADDFGDRMQRIKNSLEKINQLMTELKKTTRKREFED